MKIDSHVLFLIIVIGIISAGIVGATVMNTDTSMKQEAFDGITVLVPADSEFVKVDNGVYKDANYGIKINTFKNNDSMINFLKNTKKSKIIPIDGQPPQSVAFKKGDTINILVTNGNEGISVGSKDGELTSKIANNVVFSNNHKSQKPVGVPFAKQPMKVEKDYNLIMLLVADVDTKVFNVDMLQNNLIVVEDNYNQNLSQPVDNIESVEGSEGDLGEVSDISNQEELNDALTDGDNATTTSTSASSDSSQESQPSADSSNANSNTNDDVAQATVVSEDNSQSSNSGNAAGGDINDNSAGPSDNVQSVDSNGGAQSSDPQSNTQQQQKLSEGDCQQYVEQALKNHPELKIDRCEASGDAFVFYIIDTKNNNMAVGTITVDALTGNLEPDSGLKSIL